MPSIWEHLRFAGGQGDDHPGQSYDEQQGAESQDMAMYVSYPLPSAGTNFPTIIVAQEAFGVTRHIEKVCDRFAQEGFVAVAPALFHREHPNPKLPYGDPTIQRYMGALRGDDIIEDINQVIIWTQSDQFRRTNNQKIGIVGYCMGGRVAYLAATSCTGVDASVVYYGGNILNPLGDGLTPIDLTSQISCPVMGNFGGQDANPSTDDVATIDAALTAAGVSHDFKSYPDAGHGFNCDERDSWNEAAAADALARSIAFFDQHLKG
jgi:carboxymethylenebutenolidase